MSPRLLVIECSPRGDASISRRATKRFVAHWREAHPQGEVVVRDLADAALPHVTAPWLQAYFTPPPQLTDELKARLQTSDELVDELIAADHLVIATPVHNYNVPSALKAWIDHIVRKGRTLGFDGQGLLVAKKATVLIASGGVYGEGSPIRDRDFAPRYLRMILGVIGIADVTIVAGGGAKAVDLGETTMDAFVARHEDALRPLRPPSVGRCGLVDATASIQAARDARSGDFNQRAPGKRRSTVSSTSSMDARFSEPPGPSAVSQVST